MYRTINRSLFAAATIAAFASTHAATSSAFAVLVTFDDAAPGAPYVLNDTFSSEGVDFQVDALNGGGAGGSVTIGAQTFGTLIGSDPAAYPANLNLDIDFAGSIGRQGYVGIIYSDGGGTLNLHVNGLQTDVPAAANDFSLFDGMTINGVMVDVIPISGTMGRIDLTGNIDRVVIGGQEAWFDNIRTIAIPEPATGISMAVALVLVGAWHRSPRIL